MTYFEMLCGMYGHLITRDGSAVGSGDENVIWGQWYCRRCGKVIVNKKDESNGQG